MLLMAIREGMASEEAVVEARTLLLGDARVPPELREEALTEPVEREADAAALLSLLGLDDELSDMLRGAVSGEAGEMGAVNTKSPWNESASPVAEALVSASGGVDVAESVLGRVDRDGSDWVYGPALASAVALEAGDSPVSVVEVLSRCELPQGAAVSEAVLAAAGRADVVAGVSSALSFEDSCPVAEAVRFECGFVDIADVVMDRLEQGSSAVSDLATVPAPANRSWGAWATAAIAAAVLLVGNDPCHTLAR